MIAGSLVSMLIQLIFYVLWWFVGYLNLPDPFNKAVRVILALVAVLFVLNLLLAMLGHPIVQY